MEIRIKWFCASLMAGYSRAVASERSPSSSMVRATEIAIWYIQAQEGSLSLPRFHWLPVAWNRSKSLLGLPCHFTFSLRPSEIWLQLFSKIIFTKVCSDFFLLYIFQCSFYLTHQHLTVDNYPLNLQLQVVSPFLTGLKKLDLQRAKEAVHFATILIWLWWWSISLVLSTFVINI